MSKENVVILDYQDAKKAARTLWGCFHDDGVADYVVRHLENDPERKKQVELQYYESYVVSHIMKGLVVGVKGDNEENSDTFESVAVWVKPDSGSLDDYLTLIRSGFAKLAWITGAEGRRRVFGVLFKVLHDYYEETMAMDPENGENTWTLVYLGSTPAARGKGNVRKIFDFIINNYVDPKGSLIYLESSAIRNLPIYERFGFRAINDIYLGDVNTDDHARMDVMIRGPNGKPWKYLEQAREKYNYVIPEESVAK